VSNVRYETIFETHFFLEKAQDEIGQGDNKWLPHKAGTMVIFSKMSGRIDRASYLADAQVFRPLKG
jgi:hypothetical protein